MSKQAIKILAFVFLTTCMISCSDSIVEEPLSDKHGGNLFVETYVKLKHNNESISPKSMGESAYVYMYQSTYETLTRINPSTCKLEPFLAKSWESFDNGRRFRFLLNTTIEFHDNQGFLSAQDVKRCFDSVCANNGRSVGYGQIEHIIKGIKQYKESLLSGKKDSQGVSGVKIVNDSVIEFELQKPFMPFPSLLTEIGFAIYKENNSKNAIGTGPFYIDTVLNDKMIMQRNPNYWRFDDSGFRLPYLDQITFVSTYSIKNASLVSLEDRLNLFVKDSLHVIKAVRTDDIGTIMTVLREENDLDFDYESIDYSRLFGLAFNTNNPPFDNIYVRKAMETAFNAELYVDSVRNGEGWPANYGIVPPSLTNYEDTVRVRTFNILKAKEYLSKAGYPNGVGFPEIELLAVYDNIKDPKKKKLRTKQSYDALKMICENLNITFKVKEYDRYYRLMEDTWRGKFHVSPLIYTSKYPSAVSYLNIFNVKIDPSDKLKLIEHDNIMFYRDSVFDSYYEQALAEEDENLRQKKFLKAERRMLDQVPILPISYFELNRIVSNNIEDLSPMNNLGLEDYSTTYFKK